MRRLCLSLLCILFVANVVAQPMAARSNVVPYDDENGVEKLAYRQSPYYMELQGNWKQRRTDSSVLYSRQIDVEKYWKDYQVSLHARCGRGCRVLLNGNEVGVAGDSRHWNEFLLNGHLKYGKQNTLTIEASRASVESLLEDTSLSVGLNGEPFLLFKPDPCIADYTLVSDYDAATGEGTISLSAELFNSRRKGKYYVEAELWDPNGRQVGKTGRWTVFNGKSAAVVDISRSWPGVSPWSAESPSLYTLVLRLLNEEMETEEVVGSRFGFRRVELAEGQLLVNGKPVRLKGILYGREHTEGEASRRAMREDVIRMKQANVNAVRTSRYSPMEPYFYELCDQYGLYVVCDANLLPLSEKRRAVATEQEYIPLFEHRVENLYGAYRNYSSIVAWSLGNSRDNAVCMTAAYRRLKALDTRRPVLFAGAGFGDGSDLVSFANPTAAEVRQSVSRLADRSALVLATAAGDPDTLWQLVRSVRRLQGMFVDWWPLDATHFRELRHLYRPFDVEAVHIAPDKGEFTISNFNDFAPLNDCNVEYTVYSDLRDNIIAGDLTVTAKAGESERVSISLPYDLPDDELLFIRFDLRQRLSKLQQWQSAAKRDMGSVGIPVRPQPVRATPYSGSRHPLADTVDEEGHHVWRGRGFSVRMDSVLALYGAEPVPIATVPPMSFHQHADWRTRLADRNTYRIDGGACGIDELYHIYDVSGSVVCDVRQTTSIFSGGDVVVDYQIAPTALAAGDCRPQLAHLPLLAGGRLGWFGPDGATLLPEGRNSAIVGNYSMSLPDAPALLKAVGWCRTDAGAACCAEGCGMSLQSDGQGWTVLADSLVHRSCKLRLHLAVVPEAESLPARMKSAMPRLVSPMPDPPAIEASSQRFVEPLTVSLRADGHQGDIYYTIDGSDPTRESLHYKAPFVITATTIVRARVVPAQGISSFVASRRFNYDHIQRVAFSRKPNTPYNVGADTILFDGLLGTPDQPMQHWLGFSGGDLATTVTLSKAINTQEVRLRYLHSPSTWAFAPREVTLLLSADGEHFTDTVRCAIPFNPADESESRARVAEVTVPVGSQPVKALRIEATVIDRIPDWHRAKGLNPWLLTDEIEVIEQPEDKNE